MAAVAVGLIAIAGLVAGVRHLVSDDVVRLQSRAEALGAEGHWAEALEIWSPLNAGSRATWRSYLGEGKACLALGRAAQAERALRRAIAARPAEAEASLLLLNVFRVEDRTLEAFALGWEVHEPLPPEARPELLRELTLGALADLPEDEVRGWLDRWLKADPDDVEARVAYLRRVAAEPRADDPDRDSRLASLEELVRQYPEHLGAREALVTALADAGEPERGRVLLEAWPADRRDGRYWRLKGRWDLEHDRRPDRAVAAFREALKDFPQDWRTHYRLARALQNGGHPEEARGEAAMVRRIRELLDPLVLVEKLNAAFAHLDDPAAYRTLADLCDRAGLSRLAGAWRSAGNHAADRPPKDRPDRVDRLPGHPAASRPREAGPTLAVAGLPGHNTGCEKPSRPGPGQEGDVTPAFRATYLLRKNTS